MNWGVLFGSALVPLIMGFIWYHPSVFGKVWGKEVGITEEDMKNADKSGMWKTFLLYYIFSFLAAFIYMQLGVHQMGAYGMIGGGVSESTLPSFQAFMDDYGTVFRTFGHGALHGGMASFFMGLFMIGGNALFEKKSWTYIWINVLFYTICGIIMGGLICKFV